MDPALDRFQPLVAAWFQRRFHAPTDVQRQVWTAVADGAHVLATAPTGSGKTLAAFLWSIDRLIAGAWPRGRVAVVYVSPLKALNTDVGRNLQDPLTGIHDLGAEQGVEVPRIQVGVRSGDTPAAERRRLLRSPPEILVTTPESLALLLSTAAGCAILAQARTVILDEIHAVAGTKRGTWLMLAVERLTQIAGECQRIALSATVEPLEPVAELVGGWRLQEDGRRRRPVRILRARDPKRIEVRTTLPAVYGAREEEFWPGLAKELKAVIHRNRSTLIFTNSRRMSEKLARFLNEGEAEVLAYAHHGSLAREMRQLVEERLKAGALKAIVATASLELGIDIGAIDEVVQLKCPRSLNAAVQRIGRAGHQVGAVSRGWIIPLHDRDLLEAAVLGPAVQARQVEPIQVVRNPLDVLAQALVLWCAVERTPVDMLYARVRACDAYATLARELFDQVVAMLLGRWQDVRLRELAPRLRLVESDGVPALETRSGMAQLARVSGGVIPDRGYFTIRIQATQARIGELDEEFVWERHVGDEFTIGSQTWRIAAITHSQVEVVPGGRGGAMAPFWRAEAEDRGWSLSARIGDVLEQIEPQLPQPAAAARFLQEHHQLDARAADVLVGYLLRQRAATEELPHRHRLVVERTRDATGEGEVLVLHAPWGGRVLRPLGMALAAAWQQEHGADPELAVSDDCILIHVPPGYPVPALLRLLPAERIERLIRARLPQTGFFGARFRENAARALLLPRGSLRERVPLWLTRLRAQRLLAALAPHPEFPVLVETWRSCLQDGFDLPQLTRLLEELATGAIAVHEARTLVPSPFAEAVLWSTTNTAMYADDTPNAAVIREPPKSLAHLLGDARLRPPLERAAIDELEAKLQRTAPGYAPTSGDDLADLVLERVLVPALVWQRLIAAATGEVATASAAGDRSLVGARLRVVLLPGAPTWAVVEVTQLPRIARALAGRGNVAVRTMDDQGLPSGAAAVVPVAGEDADGDDGALELLVTQWLRGRGPVQETDLACWGLPADAARALLETLTTSEEVVAGLVVTGEPGTWWCDRENVDRLLRQARSRRRARVEALPLTALPPFLARWMGIGSRSSRLEDLQTTLEQLFGWTAEAGHWEQALLPARHRPYVPADLDRLLQSSDLVWFGAGPGRLGFAFRAELTCFLPERSVPDAQQERLLPPQEEGIDTMAAAKRAGMDLAAATEALWALAWQGQVTTDTWVPVRAAAQQGFAPTPPPTTPVPRRGWQLQRPLLATWRRLPPPETSDPLARLAWDRDRARQITRRYGVVFRELLAHELPALGWARLLPALRLLELAGELVSGHFFEGVPGLQFALPQALPVLVAATPSEPLLLTATDPASGCGLSLEGLRGALPTRLPTTLLAWYGDQLLVILRRLGAEWDIRMEPADPRLDRILEALLPWLDAPLPWCAAMEIERINGLEAVASPFRPAFDRCGFHAGMHMLQRHRRFA